MNLKTTLSIGLFFCFLTVPSSIKAQIGGPNLQDLEVYFESDLPEDFQQNELDSLISWQERILLHIDKPIVNEGSPLFFKAYTLTGPNRVRATLSKVLKVELISKSQDVLVTQYHQIQEGMSEGVFEIPKKLENGSYTLRAYTRWMQNYGESFYAIKKLVLGEVDDAFANNEEVVVSFHPEGGGLISNFNNRLLIKASTKEGYPANIKGDIIDEEGNRIMPLVSFDNGIMSTIFKPNSNQNYRLKTNDGSIFKLPRVNEKGYVLNVNNLNPELLNIRVQASPEISNRVVKINGIMGGVTYFSNKLDLKTSLAELQISKKGIPFGVMTISLVDENNQQVSKRPVFIDVDNTLKLSIAPLNENGKSGELAFKVKVSDSDDNPVATQVTLSATNTVSRVNEIKIEEHSGFNWERDELVKTAKNSARTNRFKKDLELLISSENSSPSFQNLPDKIKYPFQKGLDLFGYAYDLNNKLLENTKIQMLSASDANVVVKELETDGSGRIRIENLQLVGDNELIFRTKGDDTKSRLVKLVPIQESYDEDHKPKSILDFKKTKNRDAVQSSPWQPISSDDMIELEEVVVLESKMKENKTTPSVYGIVPDRVVFQDVKRPVTIPQLLMGIPGVQVIGFGTLEPRLSLPRAAGMGPVLWVIDGFPLIQPTSLLDIINLISSADVERIEILYGAQAAIYGTRASGGAIVLYTRSAAGLDYINRKEGRLNFQGYYESLSFDSYSELLSKRPKKYEDKATTLFWNPNIQTDENGEAIVRFTPPIDYKNLKIKVSTVTEKGEIASTKLIF
ncbi:TonB-dependent receptor [Croceitalea vernalis]|uniref:TonB-dependent receptor plug domain-containing protein n=1 Tax=Croceitalea vernalis TaxID=3075599 RepID=A0ABU3BKC9_9FLAO|nr:TonB-dependent receptor plug domain-containing protein [Croceitalea sp. P007]MDT0622624.1 TonB-dependent receptor plug domain-containing protein [Croceitalea sp. P007]